MKSAMATAAERLPSSGKLLLLLLAAVGWCGGLFFWYTGPLILPGEWTIRLILFGLLIVNTAPVGIELLERRFDPFDPKHVFLAYFFIVFTLNCWNRAWFDLEATGGFPVPEPSEAIRIRSLSAVLICLSAFIGGCYLPFGKLFGAAIPTIPPISRGRVRSAAWIGIGLGLFAFLVLIQSAGGIRGFLSDLGSWRTTGVLAGVGYLTFPITVILPASALLLLLLALPPKGRSLNWASYVGLVIYFASLLPVVVLGFRGNLLPALLQFFAVWHYARKRIQFGSVALLAAALVVFLSVYGVIRSVAGGEERQDHGFATAVLFRVPGLDTVERVIWQLDRGEPHRGLAAVFLESTTILVPRTFWPNKPQPASLAFADIFFFDFFLERGDPLDGVKSGVSPTLVGELLWIGGLPILILGSAALGVFACAVNAWRRRAPNHPLHILIAAIFMGSIAIFVEAPQNTLNTFVMLATFCIGLAIILSVRIHRRRNGHSQTALAEAGNFVTTRTSGGHPADRLV